MVRKISLGVMAAPPQDLNKRSFLHRFRDVAVHAGFQALLTVSCQGIGGDSHNLRSRRPASAYLPGGQKAVHLGHLHINEYEVLRLPFQELYNLFSISHGVCPVSHF